MEPTFPMVRSKYCQSTNDSRISGSPDHVAWEARRLEALLAEETFEESEPVPLSLSTFERVLAGRTDITRDTKWRSCCCQQCAEVDALLASWGQLMSVVHSESDSLVFGSGGLDRRESTRCEDPLCLWRRPGGEHIASNP
jgi:hypothetical protein